MWRSFILALMILAGLGARAEAADNRLVVVELFTSQGCSSCPPADKFLHELAARDDVLALGLHVDYWDYIGWKDVFASPQFSKRQRAYARAGGRRSVYTPQMIIQGHDHVVGTMPNDVKELVRLHQARGGDVALAVERTERGALLRAEAGSGAAKRAMAVVLVRYRPEARTEIKRGENAGRELSYANIVTELKVLKTWDMRGALELPIQISGSERAAVFLQERGPGPIAAAVRLD